MPLASAHHPHDVIGALGISPNFPEDRTLFVASPGSINVFLVSHDGGHSWTESRTNLPGLQITDVALASDWKATGAGYVTLEDRGLYETTDRGRTWHALGPDVKLRHLALVQPEGSSRPLLYCATRTRLYETTPGEPAHEVANVPLGECRISSLGARAVSLRTSVLAVATEDARLLVSQDRGQSWTEHHVPAPVRCIVFSPRFESDHVLWLGTWGAGVLRSTDLGASHEPGSQGVTDAFVNDLEVTADRKNGFDLFAATRDDGVFHSADAGRSWRALPLSVSKTNQTDNHYRIVRASPGWPEDPTLFCGTFEGLFVSSDGGESWWEASISPTRMGRCVAISPAFATDRTVFASGYGMHVLASQDGGEHWDHRVTDLGLSSVYSLALSPPLADNPLVLVGASRGIRRSTDLGRTWTTIEFASYRRRAGGMVPGIVYSPGFASDRTVYALNSYGTLFRSEDAGVHWSSTQVPMNWSNSLALSPAFDRDSTLFVSGTHLYRSDDGGKSFSRSLMEGLIPRNGIALAPDFEQSGELYCLSGTRGFVRLTQRGEKSKACNQGLDHQSPTAIALSPHFLEDSTLFVLTAGGGLHRSTDRGRTWTRVTPPGSPVDHGLSLAISPDFARDHTFFAGTFEGICRSRDGGASWELVTGSELYGCGRAPIRGNGDWKIEPRSGCINGTVRVTTSSSAELDFPFCGRGLRIHGTVGPDHGTADLVLDGRSVARIDAGREQPAVQQVLARILDLAPGFHRLQIKHTSDAPIGIEAIEVLYGEVASESSPEPLFSEE